MQPGSSIVSRLCALVASAMLVCLAACSAEGPVDGDPTAESELTSCGRVEGGRIVDRGLNACVPGTEDFVFAGCLPGTRRSRLCDSSCRFGAFGACSKCPASSCAGKAC